MKNFFILTILNVVLLSCARVGSPVGGARDTIPPEVIGTNIDTSRINIPRDIRELRLDFDEYITLRDINKNLIISPPIQKITKILPSGMANKYILIKWSDTLQENTTYNFNFGNAIVDNNEGNPLRYYNFAFSTGSKIDDLYISGEVKNVLPDPAAKAEELNLVVGLYKADSLVNYRQKPYYITKADPDGYYELNFLSPGKYRILAFNDSNFNSVYDAGKETVAFQKEVLVLDKSISGLNMNLYPSRRQEKYLEMKAAPGGILMTFEGNPQAVTVKSLNEKLRDIRVTHQPKSDSVHIWFDAKANNVGIANSENLRFSYDTGSKQDTVSLFYRHDAKDEMTITNSNGNLVAPDHDFVINSNYAIDQIQPEKWTLVSDSIAQDFTARIAERNPFQMEIRAGFKEGKKYELTVPKETVSSYYASLQKSYRFDFEVDKSENYGTLVLQLENAPQQRFWLQLLNDSGNVVYSRFGKESTPTFNSLKPGKYQIRILVDNNENGIWDSADLLSGEFAEDVYVFGKSVEIRPFWEIRETWNLKPASGVNSPEVSTPLEIRPQ